MINQNEMDLLPPLAYQWAKTQEEIVLRHGAPLGPRQLEDAERAGVQHPSRVRLLVVDRIAPPDNPQLAEAARNAQVITDASRVVTVGYGIIIRADSWQNRELLLHSLVHVAQCERSGGLENFVGRYLTDRRTCADFSVGSLEDEARGLAREILATEALASRT